LSLKVWLTTEFSMLVYRLSRYHATKLLLAEEPPPTPEDVNDAARRGCLRPIFPTGSYCYRRKSSDARKQFADFFHEWVLPDNTPVDLLPYVCRGLATMDSDAFDILKEIESGRKHGDWDPVSCIIDVDVRDYFRIVLPDNAEAPDL
jgi:hypothetical protein